MTDAARDPLAGIPVLDAHHHLWQLDAVDYPWLMAKGVRRFFGDPTPIQRDYRADDLVADAAGLDLIGSVHIQVGCAPAQELAETEWLHREAENPGGPGLPQAIVAFTDLSAADAPAMLEKQAAFPRVRGIRQIIGRNREEDARTNSAALLNDAVWRENLARLPGLKLSFDLQATPWQLTDCARVFAAVPDLDVVLCHCGSPWEQDAAGLRRWRQGLAALAENPRVHVKLSGLAMFDHDWSVPDIAPIVEALVESFGPRRLMVGSNFPVDGLHKPYGDIMRGYATALSPHLTAGELRAAFADTARRFYRL